MKTLKLLGIFLCLFVNLTWAQEGYLVKTTAQRSTVGTDEEMFVEDNFPYYMLCEWKPGLKFMFIGEEKYNFISIFKNYETGRDVENAKFQYQVLEFVGTEETEKESYVGKSFDTRFIFECNGEKVFHEFKNQKLADLCVSNSRAHIKGLTFLGDVDIAKELLTGLTLYTKIVDARVDDQNSNIGFRDVKISPNMEVTVTAVGVGNREYPVKIVFEDKNGNSYYTEQAFSRTNSGLAKNDFQGTRLLNCFSNAFRFNDESTQSTETIKKKYIGRFIYPKRTIQAYRDGSIVTLLRYTPLQITDLTMKEGTMAALKLKGRTGEVYTTDVDLKYNVFIKNDNYIDDIFGTGDLRRQYSYITEDNWTLITNGEVKIGMTRDECRLSLGSPVQIVKNTNSKYETWYYQGKILDFEGDALIRIK